MAICSMVKVIIVSHRAESTEMLEALQGAGVCQILNADEAMVSKQMPELGPSAERPRETEAMLNRLRKAAGFLKGYAKSSKGLASALAPRKVIDEQMYKDVVSDEKFLGVVQECEQVEAAIEKLNTDQENLGGIVAELAAWVSLETPVEEIGQLEATKCLTGLIPVQQFEEITEQIGELDGVVDRVGEADNRYACLIVCLNEQVGEVQKLLRAADFEAVNFESMSGTAADLIKQHDEELEEAKKQLQEQHAKAASLSKNLLKLEILCDHYANLLEREQTGSAVPTTEQTVILEGWVKEKDFGRLEKIVAGFGASSLNRVEPGEDEEVPVEIDNGRAIRPFESITRLYGMPMPSNLDPTVFLAPFFMIFFGLCLTDAGYGLIMVAILWYLLKKMQGDTKFMWMLLICSVSTIVAGVITGGWFGDAVQTFLPESVDNMRKSLMVFDPMTQPMLFFGISLSLGYIQIMFGLCIALSHNLRRKDIIAALCDQVTWLVMLNSLILFGLSKGGLIASGLAGLFGIMAVIPAITILLFSERKGGWGGRIGMGVFNLFCTVFYLGDVLSYVRIMALGMVTSGFGLAVNISVKLLVDVPYVGWLLGALVFVGGHLLNIALSALGSFVHSMRLQFVEFFPKFFEGGGKQFVPLSKAYKNIQINNVKM